MVSRNSEMLHLNDAKNSVKKNQNNLYTNSQLMQWNPQRKRFNKQCHGYTCSATIECEFGHCSIV